MYLCARCAIDAVKHVALLAKILAPWVLLQRAPAALSESMGAFARRSSNSRSDVQYPTRFKLAARFDGRMFERDRAY